MGRNEKFERHRPLLFSIAYRMLGSAMDAGDAVQGLPALLSEDVTLWSDGGGKVVAARNLIHGADNVARFLFRILTKAPPGLVVRRTSINGRLGLVGYFEDGHSQSVTTLDVAEGIIQAIRVVVNPEKLESVPSLEPE